MSRWQKLPCSKGAEGHHLLSLPATAPPPELQPLSNKHHLPGSLTSSRPPETSFSPTATRPTPPESPHPQDCFSRLQHKTQSHLEKGTDREPGTFCEPGLGLCFMLVIILFNSRNHPDKDTYPHFTGAGGTEAQRG